MSTATHPAIPAADPHPARRPPWVPLSEQERADLALMRLREAMAGRGLLDPLTGGAQLLAWSREFGIPSERVHAEACAAGVWTEGRHRLVNRLCGERTYAGQEWAHNLAVEKSARTKSEYVSELRKQRRTAGLCWNCTSPAVAGKTKCRKHLRGKACGSGVKEGPIG